MNNTERQNTESTGIQSLLDQYLASRNMSKSSVGETSFHLDEDTLAAFAEGNVSSRESGPMIRHLVDCGFCRHKTAELVMLDLELAETDDVPARAITSEPATISSVLNDVLAKIFGTSDQAVFAHNEDDEKNENEENKKEADKES